MAKKAKKELIGNGVAQKVKPRFRKLKDSDKIQIMAEIEAQGLDYWVQNYASEYEGTEIGPFIAQAKEGLNALENVMGKWDHLLLDEDGDHEEDEE